MALAHRNLPTQRTFFVSGWEVARVLASASLAADALAGVHEKPFGPPARLDPPFENIAALVEDLQPGVRVIDTSAPRKLYPGRWGLSPRLWRDGLHIDLRPEDVLDGWPKPVWRVGEVEGLRWHIVSGKQAWLVADAYTLLGPITKSESIGVGGEAVDAIHETISTLTPDRVHAFGWRGYAEFDHPALDRGDPLRLSLSRASVVIELDFEARAEKTDPDAGGEVLLMGDYPVYRLTDKQWLGAMAAAQLAARTQVLAERMTPEQVELRMRPWRVLIGEESADRLPEMTDPRLSVPPSADLIRTLVPWQERGLAGRVRPWVTFPYRHPIWTAIVIVLVTGLLVRGRLVIALLLLPAAGLFVIGLLVLLVIWLLWRCARR